MANTHGGARAGAGGKEAFGVMHEERLVSVAVVLRQAFELVMDAIAACEPVERGSRAYQALPEMSRGASRRVAEQQVQLALAGANARHRRGKAAMPTPPGASRPSTR